MIDEVQCYSSITVLFGISQLWPGLSRPEQGGAGGVRAAPAVPGAGRRLKSVLLTPSEETEWLTEQPRFGGGDNNTEQPGSSSSRTSMAPGLSHSCSPPPAGRSPPSWW